jgi:HSP20 family protein
MTFESDPFNDLLRLQEQLAGLLGASPENRSLGGWSSGVYPPINVFRKEDAALLRAEIPGVKPEDLSITVEGQQLTLSGERRPPDTANMACYRRERPWGKFSRSIRLPDDLDTERVEAQFRNGVLTLTVPVAAAAKPRQIAVKAA